MASITQSKAVSKTVRRNAKAVSPLQQAMNKIVATKVDPKLLKGRAIVDVQDSMDVLKLPIDVFMNFIKDVEPIKVQRNDLYRLSNGLAKHLDALELPQAMFALISFEGNLYLVDGNTRKRAWLNNPLRTLPSHVFVTVMVIDSEDHAKRIYDCYDSKASKKTNRDELLSMLHEAGVEPSSLKSKLVAGGKLVSVVRCMTRALFSASASAARKQQVVQLHADSFVELDRQDLDEGTIKGGAVWALLRLYKEVPREFYEYIDDYVGELRKLDTSLESQVATSVLDVAAIAAKERREFDVGTTGEAAIPVTFPVYLRGFETYAQQRSRQGRVDKKFKKFISSQLPEIIDVDTKRASALLTKLRAKVAFSS